MANWKERRLRSPLPSKQGPAATPQSLVEHHPLISEGTELILLNIRHSNTWSSSSCPSYTPNPHCHYGKPIARSSPPKAAVNTAAQDSLHQPRLPSLHQEMLPSILPHELLPSPLSTQPPDGRSTQASWEWTSRVNAPMSEALGTFTFPFMAIFTTLPPAPWPLTFMPRAVGLPVGRSQVHRP